MDDLIKEVIPLLQYLIPGFLAAWIFYSLTAFKRPDTFGQIVQALIFTFVIQSLVAGLGALMLVIGGTVFFARFVGQKIRGLVVSGDRGVAGFCFLPCCKQRQASFAPQEAENHHANFIPLRVVQCFFVKAQIRRAAFAR
jgi:hypothetical protein